jgi:hypothetical protein
MNTTFAIILLIINIFLPGIGTIIAGIQCERRRRRNFNIICGILQLLLAIILIGWIWSIIWGILIYKRNTGAMKMIP